MNQPKTACSPVDQRGFDSLTADLVVADDRGGTTILPADAAALARFIAECRRLEAGPAAKEKKPRS
jgi:hypothetical protein